MAKSLGELKEQVAEQSRELNLRYSSTQTEVRNLYLIGRSCTARGRPMRVLLGVGL